MRKSLLITAITLALSAPVACVADELTLGYVDGKDWYAAYYKAAIGIDETVAALVQGSTSEAVEAVGFRFDLGRYGAHGEVDILTDTYRKYTQVEYKVGF